jgi:16S rRNA (cytosine967-C5)-methyltransferase
VRPGGRLVYAVCSLEPEEGEAQIAAFLARHPDFTVSPAEPDRIGAPAEALRPEGWLRILPSCWSERGGVDGFFICRLARAEV